MYFEEQYCILYIKYRLPSIAPFQLSNDIYDEGGDSLNHVLLYK